MTPDQIISHLPYKKPFLFVDHLETVDADGARGRYCFDPSSSFYQGHFSDYPVTPGVLLTECMAQIGLVSLGIYLLEDTAKLAQYGLAMSSSEIQFYLPVFPGETVRVISKKVYFRFQKLKCQVAMYNEKDALVCRGTISGMVILVKETSH